MRLFEFQEMMHRLYFHKDSKRDIDKTYKRLVDEVEELGEALKIGKRKNLENEFADVVAWLASLANVTNVDLEKAAISKYDEKCPKCRKMPCTCPL